MRRHRYLEIPTNHFERKLLLEAHLDNGIWELETDDPEVIHSLTCKRAVTSKGMGWQRLDDEICFYGRFYSYMELRKNLERLVMRATTYDFDVDSSDGWVRITATDSGYVDRLPPLAKHSKSGRLELAKLNSKEVAAIAASN